jgi:DNA-binding NarL/FixJ family response regulator
VTHDHPTLVMQASVLVIDDDAIVRSWLRAVLRDSEFSPAGEVRSSPEALDLIARRRVDILLIDLRLPGEPGDALLRQLRQQGVRQPAVLMTANPEPGLNERARLAGAQGTVLKTGSIDDLLEALRAVHAGGSHFDARHPRRPVEQIPLSGRERELLILVERGYTNPRIAAELGISLESVKTILRRAYTKLSVGGRVNAVSEARARGLL